MSVPKEGSSSPKGVYISPGTEPGDISTKRTSLPKGRELKWWKKGVAYSLLHEYPDTPACPYGTLQEDNGSGKIPPDEPKVVRG